MHAGKHIVGWAGDKCSFVLTVAVRPSVSLHNFRQSQRNTIEVLVPAGIHGEFAERVRRMAERYEHAHGN